MVLIVVILCQYLYLGSVTQAIGNNFWNCIVNCVTVVVLLIYFEISKSSNANFSSFMWFYSLLTLLVTFLSTFVKYLLNTFQLFANNRELL